MSWWFCRSDLVPHTLPHVSHAYLLLFECNILWLSNRFLPTIRPQMSHCTCPYLPSTESVEFVFSESELIRVRFFVVVRFVAVFLVELRNLLFSTLSDSIFLAVAFRMRFDLKAGPHSSSSVPALDFLTFNSLLFLLLFKLFSRSNLHFSKSQKAVSVDMRSKASNVSCNFKTVVLLVSSIRFRASVSRVSDWEFVSSVFTPVVILSTSIVLWILSVPWGFFVLYFWRRSGNIQSITLSGTHVFSHFTQ